LLVLTTSSISPPHAVFVHQQLKSSCESHAALAAAHGGDGIFRAPDNVVHAAGRVSKGAFSVAGIVAPLLAAQTANVSQLKSEGLNFESLKLAHAAGDDWSMRKLRELLDHGQSLRGGGDALDVFGRDVTADGGNKVRLFFGHSWGGSGLA
jgi:hypothetical protein